MIMMLRFSILVWKNLEIADQKLKLFVPFVISVVKKCDDIFGVNKTMAYYDRLEKTHSDRYDIKMRR